MWIFVLVFKGTKGNNSALSITWIFGAKITKLQLETNNANTDELSTTTKFLNYLLFLFYSTEKFSYKESPTPRDN
jgi:hypothetical protein